jgi:glyoxylase-like metal-dependent hydrolase (beta-lactamase superfamily II)
MKVGPGIWRAESSGEVVYALDCGGAYVLFDVGSPPGLRAKLDELQQEGVDLARVAALLITHNHQDHCGALARIRSDLPLRVVAHRLAVERLGYCSATVPIARELVDYTVDEGDAVEVGEATLQVRHLPGHTPDSVAWQRGHDLFVGDIIFSDGGIGWMDVHWGSCVSDYRSSLLRLMRFGARNIYPGHRDCGPLTREVVEEALKRLSHLAEADGSPINYLGHTAPRRSPEEPAKSIHLSLGKRA